MIKSMTGFGRERIVNESREITVEIKSVNHRYFDFYAKTPRAYGYLDEKLKELTKNKISRGKVEVSVSIVNQEGVNADIEINKELAKGYYNALESLKDEIPVEDDLSLSSFMRLPDIFTVVKKTDDEETIWNEVKDVAETALERFVQMRVVEGEKMYNDISSRLDFLENAVTIIEEKAPESVKAYENRLYTKLKEVLEDKNIDEQRIITEAAIFSDKVAVDEETVRLRSHISQFRDLLKSDEPVGRKIDFLIQEMNREVNTTGSKVQDLEITKLVVDMKAEIEKIREQIQNVE
ncbi:MAG: YicC/YloC family endoribonuclease [Oscillospiraceae bacterium]